jgi:hypothetical protein
MAVPATMRTHILDLLVLNAWGNSAITRFGRRCTSDCQKQPARCKSE